MHHLSDFVTHYGYWAVALGCLLEGETLLLLAGFAAKQGYLSLPLVMTLGASLGAASDMFFFWLGRRHGHRVLARWPGLERHRERLDHALGRWGAWVVIGVRFMYGMRIAGPVLLGTSSFAWSRFALFNLIGAAIWAVLVTGAGWVFGHAAEAMLGRWQSAELGLAAGLLVALMLWGGWRLWRRRSKG